MEILIFTLFLAVILGWIRLVSYLTESRENRENKRFDSYLTESRENRAHKKMHMRHCGRMKEQISIQHNFAKAIFLFASNLRHGAE